jgi:hypothetical protein
MNKFGVEVNVEITRTYLIEANNPDEAREIAEQVFCCDLDPELGENNQQVICWDTKIETNVSVISERAQ